MFDKMKIPVVAAVENMSYFICDSCDKQHKIFGEGALRRIVEEYGIENSFEIPMYGDIAIQGDKGIPFVCLEQDSNPVLDVFNALGDKVIY